MPAWTIEIEGDSFSKFYLSLPSYERVVIDYAMRNILAHEGINICAGEWGKPLGGGLYEFRIRKSLQSITEDTGSELFDFRVSKKLVLLRIFCTFHGNKIIVIFHGYDKQRDPSSKRQQREINKARILLQQWKYRL